MREGAKWELYLPPELAYGSRGPLAHQTVIYEIELLEVNEKNRPMLKTRQMKKNNKYQS